MTNVDQISLMAQALGFGGAIHLAIVTRKTGWIVIATGISLMTVRTLLGFPESLVFLRPVHVMFELLGITLLFRAYKHDADELEILADAVPYMAWLTDTEGNVTYVNKRFEAYTGKRCGELEGKPWLWAVGREDRTQVSNAWTDSVRSGVDFESEHRLLASDGSCRWFYCRGWPVAVGGKVTRWYVRAVDINNAKEGLQSLKENRT